MNICLTDSEAIVNYVRDHVDPYDKLNNTFKDKVKGQEGLPLGEVCKKPQPVSEVCKTWSESQKIRNGKLTQSKTGQAPKEMLKRQNLVQNKLHIVYNFFKINF